MPPTAYTTNLSSDSGSVIDTASNAVTATVPVGALAQGLPTPDGITAYGGQAEIGEPDEISVIDLASNTASAVAVPGHRH